MVSKKNKKSNVTYILSIVLITILTFFIYLNFFVLNTKNVSDNSEDLLCRSLVSSKDLSVVKAGEFFYQLNYKCHKDFIKDKNVKSKEEVFKIIADSQKRCWYRYGEGKYDFMSNLNKDGFWCFECGQLDFSGSDLNHEVYSYAEYIEYLKTVKLKVGEEEMTYYNYMNLRYANSEKAEEFYSIRGDIDDLLQEGDSNFNNLGMIYNEQYIYISDLMKKKIDTGEKIYIIYRYDKPTEDFSDKVLSATYSGIKTTAGVMAVGIVIEKAISISLTAASCAAAVGTGGLATPLCVAGIGYTAASFGKTASKVATKAVKIAKLIEKANKIRDVFQDSVKFSKKTMKAMKAFTGNVAELEHIGKDISKIKKYEDLGKDILKTSEDLKKMNINHFDDIEKGVVDLNGEIENINLLFDRNYKMLDNDGLEELVSKQKFYSDQKDALIKLQQEIAKYETDFGKLTENMPIEKKSWLLNHKMLLVKGTIALASGATAGTIAYNSNYNDNQYVDLMTEEQYYRLCGTRSYAKDEK